MKLKFWFYIIFAPLLGLGLAGLQIYYQLAIWTYDGPQVEFKVSPGESFASVNYRLHKQNLIKNKKIFHRYAQFNHLMTKIKQGNFTIPPGSSMIDIIELLISSKGQTFIKVTIPEGKNLYEIAEILAKKNITPKSDFIKVAKNTHFIEKLGIKAETLEGRLYPETYFFSKGMTPEDVALKFVSTFNEKTSNLDFSQSDLSQEEILTLASIIEKETGASFERPIISGVFHNRLKKGMRLQSDPTTIYGIYERFNGNLKKEHLLEKTPYNTYKINGLPKGPIANPGRKSLEAALQPEKHPFLYFVSKNDGTHIFSKSYKEHKAAVENWQINSRNRKGKSWRDLTEKSTTPNSP